MTATDLPRRWLLARTRPRIHQRRFAWRFCSYRRFRARSMGSVSVRCSPGPRHESDDAITSGGNSDHRLLFRRSDCKLHNTSDEKRTADSESDAADFRRESARSSSLRRSVWSSAASASRLKLEESTRRKPPTEAATKPRASQRPARGSANHRSEFAACVDCAASG